jgi:GGDEF domain-containing protein
MKNVQVIDGADNCTYDIYALTDDEFAIVFPNDADIEFIEDLVARVGEEKVAPIAERMWARRMDKKKIVGIHGTLFYELLRKAAYYPTKREADAVPLAE